MGNTKNGLVNYDYFNLTDEAISADHFDFTGVPRCTATDANYFRMNDLYFDSMRHLERYLLQGLKDGQTNFYFKIADDGHKMADIIMAARNFVLAEASSRELMANISASYKEEQRTGRIIIKPVI